MLKDYVVVDPLPEGVPPDNATAAHTSHFLPDFQEQPRNDYTVLENKNGLCIVRLATGHPLCSGASSDVLRVELSPALANATFVKGRGPDISQGDLTVRIHDSATGVEYELQSPVRGKLVDVNARFTSPEALTRRDLTQGYILILEPSGRELERLRDESMTAERYQENLRNRIGH